MNWVDAALSCPGTSRPASEVQTSPCRAWLGQPRNRPARAGWHRSCEGREGERCRASEHCALGTRLLSPAAAADQVTGLEPPARAPRRLRAPTGHRSPRSRDGPDAFRSLEIPNSHCSPLGQALAASRSLRAGLLPGDLLLQSSGVRGVKLHAEAHGEGGLGCREKSDATVTTRQGLSPPSPPKRARSRSWAGIGAPQIIRKALFFSRRCAGN